MLGGVHTPAVTLGHTRCCAYRSFKFQQSHWVALGAVRTGLAPAWIGSSNVWLAPVRDATTVDPGDDAGGQVDGPGGQRDNGSNSRGHHIPKPGQ